VCLAEQDADAFHAALGYNTSQPFMAQHKGVLLASVTGVTVVHDAVLCNASHALTAFATKHAWHPPVCVCVRAHTHARVYVCIIHTYTHMYIRMGGLIRT